MIMLELGAQAKKAIEAARKALKIDPNLTGAVTVVMKSTESWNPSINGRPILTPVLRRKLADAFAHLSFNMNRADAGQEPL